MGGEQGVFGLLAHVSELDCDKLAFLLCQTPPRKDLIITHFCDVTKCNSASSPVVTAKPGDDEPEWLYIALFGSDSHHGLTDTAHIVAATSSDTGQALARALKYGWW